MTAMAAMQGAFDRSSGTAQGMALMLFSTVCFVAMQSMIRHVGETLPPFEVAFFRNLFGLVALAPVFIQQGITPFRTKKLGLHATRGAIQACGMLAFFTGVTLIPLAQTTALSFSAPLFATLLAILVLGSGCASAGSLRWCWGLSVCCWWCAPALPRLTWARC